MKLDTLRFSSTMLRGTNKVGLVKPDENGYYTLVLGAFNIHNDSGDYYPLTQDVQDHFTPGSPFMIRIQRQSLRGERDHPWPTPGMSKDAYLRRLSYLEPNNISHHISEVWLDTTNYKDKQGRMIVAVLGKVKPSGPQGQYLQSALDNPHENVAFSVRSLSRNVPMLTGGLRRSVTKIITWDHVLEGGIEVADKFFSPSLESAREFVFDRKTVITATNKLRAERQHNASLESASLSLEELCQSMGWQTNGTNDFINW